MFAIFTDIFFFTKTNKRNVVEISRDIVAHDELFPRFAKTLATAVRTRACSNLRNKEFIFFLPVNTCKHCATPKYFSNPIIFFFPPNTRESKTATTIIFYLNDFCDGFFYKKCLFFFSYKHYFFYKNIYFFFRKNNFFFVSEFLKTLVLRQSTKPRIKTIAYRVRLSIRSI